MTKIKSLLRRWFTSDALTEKDIQRMLFRNKFSEYLPFRAYDPEEGTFFNTDESLGWIWECAPLVLAGEQTFQDLGGLFTAGIPDGAVLQVIFYADPHIDPYLKAYKNLKTRDSEIIRETTDRTIDFLQTATKGMPRVANIPTRRGRLFFVLKLPFEKNMSKNEVLSLRDGIFETLNGAYLHPVMAHPDMLIQLMAGIMNDEIPEMAEYDPHETINRQIILSETPIIDTWKKIKIGKKHLRCQTVKKMAKEVDNLSFNYLTGDIWGLSGDNNQINTPFLITVNIIFADMAAGLHAKTNFVLQQQAVGSLAPSLQRKQEEYLWASGMIDNGEKFIRIMPIIWSFADSETESRETAARIKRIFDSRGFKLQEDRGILKVLLLAAIPFGLYTKGKAVDFIDRDFICHPEIAVKCLPVQFDLMGGGLPHMLYVGRKGQLIPFDIFAGNNYNGSICASSGSGKSFVTNKMVYELYASGAKIRIVDIGGSYKKLCDILGGKFINFSTDSKICLNPFTHITNIDEDIASLVACITQMIFSKSQRSPNETESTTIREAIKAVYKAHGNNGNIDSVYEALKSPSKYIMVFAEMEEGCEEDNCGMDIKKGATEMAYNLRAFTSEGEYGQWFNGEATLDISKDEFVVLELEELKAQPELFNVVTLMIINEISNGVYLSDRTQRQVVVIDEAWQFLGDISALAVIIEEGYRKARKYAASFWCITQSLLDTKGFGRVGAVINSNSDHKLMLQAPASDIESAQYEKIISYDPFMLEMIKSVKTNKPAYSEIYVDSSIGTGVMRVIVDPFSYYLYTSDATDNNKIKSLVDQGYSYPEAFNILINNDNPESIKQEAV